MCLINLSRVLWLERVTRVKHNTFEKSKHILQRSSSSFDLSSQMERIILITFVRRQRFTRRKDVTLSNVV